MESAIRDEERRQLALKLRLAATSREPMESDMRRRELSIAQPNPQSACEIAKMIAGGWVGPAQMCRASGEASGAAQEVRWRKSQSGPGPWNTYNAAELWGAERIQHEISGIRNRAAREFLRANGPPTFPPIRRSGVGAVSLFFSWKDFPAVFTASVKGSHLLGMPP